jgi:hypothetical protein
MSLIAKSETLAVGKAAAVHCLVARNEHRKQSTSGAIALGKFLSRKYSAYRSRMCTS